MTSSDDLEALGISAEDAKLAAQEQERLLAERKQRQNHPEPAVKHEQLKERSFIPVSELVKQYRSKAK